MRKSKNLHLLISSTVVILAALVYGFNPSTILPRVFDFEVDSLELKNIFRALMGLYLAFSFYWVLGSLRPKLWKAATLSNILFMGGLGFGRLISLMFDGFSIQYGIGMMLEFMMMFWGLYNINFFKNKK